jgi:hypothetical protein
MELSAADANAMLNLVGQDVAWRSGYLCPCRDPNSGAARPGCANCGGRGVMWGNPIAAVAALSGLKVSRQWEASGLWQNGDVVVSIPSDSPLYAAGPNDRVSMLESSQPFVEVLTMGGPALPYVVASIARVFWLDAENGIIEGSIPPLAADGSYAWADGDAGAPPAGQQYSISGRRVPEYFVFQDLPGDRAHFHGSTLPRRAILRLFDLFGK